MSNVYLREITKEFATGSQSLFRAVDNVTVEIGSGEFVTLLGPSGCGKTTILRMVAGFELPTAGDIILAGQPINHLPPEKRDTAMVFQSYALFPHYTVFDNVAFGLQMKQLSTEVIKNKVTAILELVGLQGLEQRFPNQLSGGQQQRVALARALVLEPKVLLFDEPLSNLDAKLRVYMRKEIRRIQRELGLTSIYVTHDQAEALTLSDKVIVMNKGEIEQVGTPVEIYQRPATEFVAEFIGAANFISAVVAGSDMNFIYINVLGKSVALPRKGADAPAAGTAVKLVARPETIQIGREGEYEGTIVLSTFMGATQEYTVMLGDFPLNVEDGNPAGRTIYQEGDKVGITFSRDSLHIVKK